MRCACRLLMIVLSFALISCSEGDFPIEQELDVVEVTEPEIIEGKYVEWNLSPKGEPVRLCVGIDSLAKDEHYAWYKVTDGKETELDKVVNNYYDTAAFSEKGIVNFLCKVSYTDADTVVIKEYPFHVAYTGLPVVYATTDDYQPVLTKTEKMPGNMAIVAPVWGGQFDDLSDIRMQINGRGTTGWYGSEKKSYNLKLDEKESICGMPKSKKWAMIDNYHDRSLLRNMYVSYVNHHVFDKMRWNPTYVMCDFVLNGEYKGTYNLAERIKLESKRLDIPDIMKVDNIIDGGFLCEIDERFDEAWHFRTTHGVNTYTGNAGVAICLKDPDEVNEIVFEHVQSIVQAAEDALFADDFTDPEIGYARYFDVDDLVEWYLIHEFACMYDASDFYTSAYFYYDPSDRKLHMGPCWDYDTALRRDVEGLELCVINAWYKRLFEDEHFVSRVKARWNEKKEALRLSVTQIDCMADDIRVSADYNFMRWPVLGTPYAGIDEWAYLKTYKEQITFLKNWCETRIVQMNEQLTN